MNRVLLRTLAVVISATPLTVFAEVSGPYTSDANTIALYHFNESSGSLLNAGGGGSALDIDNTGGATGRSGSTGGGYGAASISGFGSSFNMLAAGDGTHHTGGLGDPEGGGVRTTGAFQQTSLQGASGAFTLEAVVNSTGMVSGTEYTILSHDGDLLTSRGFLFRIIDGLLSFYSGGVSPTLSVALPSSGEHAYAPNAWFHVAFTYSGAAGSPNNASFYWTAMDSSATQANLLGTRTLNADLTGSISNSLAIGTTSRNSFRFEWDGFIDEVRISNIARDADDFLFLAPVPEPSSFLLMLISGTAFALARRRF